MDISATQTQNSNQLNYIKAVVVVIAGILLSAGNHSLLANDYLDELAVEAEATGAVTKNSQLSSTEKKQLKAMETLLKSEKPSTYKFYVKLNNKKKVRAFEAYAGDQSGADEKLQHLQKKVMDLYFAQ